MDTGDGFTQRLIEELMSVSMHYRDEINKLKGANSFLCDELEEMGTHLNALVQYQNMDSAELVQENIKLRKQIIELEELMAFGKNKS